jgi:hypothetical protein
MPWNVNFRRGGRRNLRSPKMRGSGIPLRVLIEKARIMDPVLAYFSENLDSLTKEEILEALKNALGSAHCWREACLLGFVDATKEKNSI